MVERQDSISVLFADPNLLTRDVVVQALNRQKRLRVVACARTAQEVLDAVRSTKVDVALISASLAEGPLSGFAALRQICEFSPEVRSVILFDGHEQNLVVDAFLAGARGVFCLSQSTFKLLRRCVEQVHSGQIWASCSELAEVVDALSQLAPMRVVSSDGTRLLTKREEEVVRLVAEGLQNRDIAKELKLSEHTVKNYLFRIFDKLGVSSRVELVLYAVTSAKNVQRAPAKGGNPSKKSGGRVKTRRKPSALDQ